MTIYIDNDFKCHTSYQEGLREVSTTFFDNKCETFINGYRYIPFCETWTREDGKVFKGELIAPIRPYTELDIAQRQYEQEQLKALNILLGEEE